MCELESGLTCKTRDVITLTPVRWVRTRAIVFELGSQCWDPGLRWYIGPLVCAGRVWGVLPRRLCLQEGLEWVGPVIVFHAEIAVLQRGRMLCATSRSADSLIARCVRATRRSLSVAARLPINSSDATELNASSHPPTALWIMHGGRVFVSRDAS